MSRLAARRFFGLGVGALWAGSVSAGCGSSSSDGAGGARAAAAGVAGSAGSPVANAGTSGALSAAGASGAAPGGGATNSGGSAGAAVNAGAGPGGAAAGGPAGASGAGGKGGGGGGTGGAGGTAGAPPNTAWVGTWSVSPQAGGSSFKAQTLRQIAHTSISGTEARVQLSNAFGSQAINVSDVHIANRTTGSSIDTASDKPILFGGKTTVTIPAGGLAVSDSAAFPVAALSDIAISFYLPDQVSNVTYHQQGTQTNYAAAGDVSANKDLTNPQNNGSYFLLANLDVKNAAALGAVATLGASITDGYASSQDKNLRWPNDLARRFNTAGIVVGVLNQGISGNALLHDGAGESAIKRFKRDVIDQPGIKWVIFSDDPINDLGAGSGRPTGAQLITGLQQLVTAAHGANLKFLCSTLTPFEGSAGWSTDGEVARGQVDAFIRGATSGCDGIIDQDTATHDPAHITKFLPSFDNGDGLHPNNAGLQAIADSVNLTLFK
ncbi:MAG TPA: GDSL-type esterase/lipase family protein [Polyangiaceae bacterium]